MLQCPPAVSLAGPTCALCLLGASAQRSLVTIALPGRCPRSHVRPIFAGGICSAHTSYNCSACRCPRSHVRPVFAAELRQPLCVALLRNCMSPYDQV